MARAKINQMVEYERTLLLRQGHAASEYPAAFNVPKILKKNNTLTHWSRPRRRA